MNEPLDPPEPIEITCDYCGEIAAVVICVPEKLYCKQCGLLNIFTSDE